MRTFPRLRLDNGIPYPSDAALPVGTQFARVDPPNDTSLNPIFRTWRMVLWEVVPHKHQRWNIDRREYETVKSTAFTVRDERELDADEIAWWTTWANGDEVAGLQEAA